MKKVTIETMTVGNVYGTVGVVRDAKTGRKLHTCETVRPHNFTDAAAKDAESWAAAKGYQVAEQND